MSTSSGDFHDLESPGWSEATFSHSIHTCMRHKEPLDRSTERKTQQSFLGTNHQKQAKKHLPY